MATTKVVYNPDEDGPQQSTFQGRNIQAGKEFEIDDSTPEGKAQLAKARSNPSFTVAGGKEANVEPVAAELDPNAPPKTATQSPMFPEAHHKQEVMPGGTMSAEQANETAEEAEARAKAETKKKDDERAKAKEAADEHAKKQEKAKADANKAKAAPQQNHRR